MKDSVETPVQVTFRHLTPSDVLRGHLEKKLAPILGRIGEATDVHVTLATASHHHRQSVEIVVHGAGASLTSHAETNDMYAAIDQATARLDGQVRKRKDRAAGTPRRASAAARRQSDDPDEVV